VVGRDITERKRLERHQQILVAELNHRVKNTLSIVQSLAHQTFGKGSPPQDAIAAFEGRLQALAAAHNLLTSRNWEAASISDVILGTLAPFSPQERCHVQGPEHRVPPETAVGLSLAVHELATNASKYGALSNESGSLSITWTIADDRFELLWLERGGPLVEPPSRSGFGTKMIKRTLAAEFKGEVELKFDQSGLVCRVAGLIPAAPIG
jgi:two-component sensor histidine kinase